MRAQNSDATGPAWLENDELRAVLAPFERETLDEDTSIICALTEEDRIAYVNPAWKRFGLENGADDDGTWGIGTELLAIVPLVLRLFYENLFAGVRREHAHAEYSYECSSPKTMRKFHTLVFPTRHRGLVIVHSLSLETAHSARATPAVESLYRDANNIVTQCCHCRRVLRANVSPDRWDWVPEYVEHVLPRTSHGLCAICVAHFYAE